MIHDRLWPEKSPLYKKYQPASSFSQHLPLLLLCCFISWRIVMANQSLAFVALALALFLCFSGCTGLLHYTSVFNMICLVFATFNRLVFLIKWKKFEAENVFSSTLLFFTLFSFKLLESVDLMLLQESYMSSLCITFNCGLLYCRVAGRWTWRKEGGIYFFSFS